MRRRDVMRYAGSAAAFLATSWLKANPPEVTNPRATDGDSRFEPEWTDRLTITVGPTSGDLSGTTDRVLQAAVDLAVRLGARVHLLPGTWVLRNSVVLPAGVHLTGSGAETILTRPESIRTTLSADSDWYDQEVTLTNATGFQPGDGVVFQAVNPHNGGSTVIKRTLVARNGNRFRLNDGLRENLWLSGKPECASLYPLLTSENTADVVIENLTLDGNRAQCENLNGNYGGCIFLQDCNRFTIRNVIARNYNGDGISFQICHDVTVEDCISHDNTDLGLHPGSGSQRPIIRRNRLERNSQGLFWCWGVKYGLAEDNIMDDNRTYGISIGHNDTDNVMRRNTIRNSHQFGILFRDENRGADFWPNRNVLENNILEDNGAADGAAIEITGQVHDLRFTGNILKESRAAAQRCGIRIGADVGRIEFHENQIDGFATAILDRRPSPTK